MARTNPPLLENFKMHEIVVDILLIQKSSHMLLPQTCKENLMSLIFKSMSASTATASADNKTTRSLIKMAVVNRKH